ncbi:hypothetical protein [Sphaerisporangium siamense]|uniref:Uncharacterized protein n=1 Tax=Sphaerisporangium siamense TaxID=795645 RepID=A0A7W7D5H4_9ACTN|nr:hypothetical protein [Sphaerisporangium siamense]MBB4699318.1 hypothetical protein [Sphaerisporangium siamense]
MTPSNPAFEQFAKTIVARVEEDLCDYGPDEQAARVVEALTKFNTHTPITPALPGEMVDLAGFGQAPVYFYGPEGKYCLLSEVAQALGMPIWEACKWARQQHLHALEDQREMDEERGDGLLGYACLRDYLDLRLWCVAEKSEINPATGQPRHIDYGDYLLSRDRLLAFIAASPWGKELMSNMSDLFAHGMKKFMSGTLNDVPVVRMNGDGTVIPASVDELFHTDLTEEQARAKALRGPNINLEEGE